MSPRLYPTCVGQLILRRANIVEPVFVGGNAKQRRRIIRMYKGNGWTVQSMLRVGRTDKVHGRIVYINR